MGPHPGRMAAMTMATILVAAACASAPQVSPSPAGSAPTTPSPTPSASPKRVPLDTALRHLWVSTPRSIPGLPEPANAGAIELSGASLKVYPVVKAHDELVTVLSSRAELTNDGSARFELLADSLGCHKGDAGTYRLQLSTSERALTVLPLDEPCAARSAAVSGDWTLAACPTPGWCLGDLDPGPHVSINYVPFATFPEWAYSYGRFGYTVPDGWSNPEDSADGYWLAPKAGPEGSGIWVFTDPRAHKQGPDCPFELANVAPSASAIASWIASLPRLAVTNVKDVTIGGLSGTQMDLAVTTPFTCADGEINGVMLFRNASHDDFDWGIANTGRMRLFVLELAPDRALVIDIEAQDDASWKALLPVAMPIVQSFQFLH